MTREQIDGWGGVVGLGVYLLIAMPLVYQQLSGEEPTRGPFLVWALLYVAYFAAMLGVWHAGQTGWRGRPVAFFSLQFTAGAALLLLERNNGGITAILMVFTAAVAAMFLPRRAAVAVVVANTTIIALASVLRGGHPMDLFLTTFLYGLLQTLLMFTTWGEQREREANDQLAVAHTELRSASAMLAESSQAQERLRIARELHDVLGHKLSALALVLETASHQARPPASDQVTRARDLAKELLTDVRTTVGELRSRPPELRTALNTLVADLPRPRVHLQVDDALEVDEYRITVLTRCAQEIVTNAIRHSDAANLWIDVGATPERGVTLRARDDGRGAPVLKLGHGLTGLRERVEQLGGRVTIDTRDGFRVQADLPAAEVSVP